MQEAFQARNEFTKSLWIPILGIFLSGPIGAASTVEFELESGGVETISLTRVELQDLSDLSPQVDRSPAIDGPPTEYPTGPNAQLYLETIDQGPIQQAEIMRINEKEAESRGLTDRTP